MENCKRPVLSTVDHKENDLRRFNKAGGKNVLGNSPSSSKRRTNNLHKRPALLGKENIQKSKSGYQKGSIRDFFADLPRSNVDKKRKLLIFDETQLSKKSKTISTQTVKADEDVSLMTSEKPSEKYWELLAEERRLALKEALQENKELAVIVEEKDETIEKLKDDVEKLAEKASHADYLASVIEKIGEGCLDEEEDSEAQDSPPDIEDSSPPPEDEKPASSDDEKVGTFDTTASTCGETTATDYDTDTPDSVFGCVGVNSDSDKENKDPMLQTEDLTTSD